LDRHNQARQSCLALEKAWITKDRYFRLFTTIIGVCVTDAWKIINVNKCGPDESINYFSDKFTYELLQRGAILMAGSLPLPPPPPFEICLAATIGDGRATHASLFSSISYSLVEGDGTINRHPHIHVSLQKRISNVGTCLRACASRGQKRNQYTSQVRCVWCSRVSGRVRKTTIKCLNVGWDFVRMGRDECAGHCMLQSIVPQNYQSEKTLTSNSLVIF
jgi:hypothetical protein